MNNVKSEKYDQNLTQGIKWMNAILLRFSPSSQLRWVWSIWNQNVDTEKKHESLTKDFELSKIMPKNQCQCDTHLCNSSVQHLSSKVLVSCFFRTILSTDCFLALFLIQYLSNPQKHKQIANCTGALARPSGSLRLLVLTFKSQTCYSFWIFTMVLKWK